MGGTKMRAVAWIVVAAAVTAVTSRSASNAARATPPSETVRSFRVAGAQRCLWAVPDGSDSIALTAESNGMILAGRIDPIAKRPRVAWTVAVSPEEVSEPVADHAHGFAHGVHWIAFSTRSANRSFLLRLDRNLRRLSLSPISREGLPTNDLFLALEPDGVAVGHILPGVGHRIFRFDRAGAARSTVDLGGGRYRHSNGASAAPIPNGFRLLAPETLDPNRPSAILEIIADPGWRSVSIRRLVAEDAHLAMPTDAPLQGGGRLLLVRKSDDGAIVRFRLDPRGRVLDRTEIIPHSADRPRMTRSGELLLTTYESGGAAWMRVERVPLSPADPRESEPGGPGGA